MNNMYFFDCDMEKINSKKNRYKKKCQIVKKCKYSDKKYKAF